MISDEDLNGHKTSDSIVSGFGRFGSVPSSATKADLPNVEPRPRESNKRI